MKRVIFLLLICCIASPCFARIRYADKTEMVEGAKAIAVVDITKVEEVETKGKMWNYSQKATGTIEQVLKGDLKKGEKIEICGMEDFECTRCRYATGRFLLFLGKDEKIWNGSNWQRGIRPIENDKVDWYKKDNDNIVGEAKPLEEVVAEVEKIDEADQQAGLKELLPQFKVAWNIEKIDEVVDLYHPDSPIRKAYESGQKKRGMTVVEAFAKAKEKFGDIKELKVEKHLAKGNRFAVQTTFEKAGTLSSVFTLKKGLIKVDRDWEPQWFLSDVQFIDRHTPKMR